MTPTIRCFDRTTLQIVQKRGRKCNPRATTDGGPSRNALPGTGRIWALDVRGVTRRANACLRSRAGRPRLALGLRIRNGALGGCRGPQPPKSTRLAFEVDVL